MDFLGKIGGESGFGGLLPPDQNTDPVDLGILLLQKERRERERESSNAGASKGVYPSISEEACTDVTDL